MIAELGQFALVLALGAALVQACAGLLGGHRNDARVIGVAHNATFVNALLIVAAFGALTYAHVTSDFSVLNVVEHSHSAKPLIYKITGVWGNHEGSMLLWLLVLGGYATAVAALARSPTPQFRARVLGVLGLVAIAFGAYVVFASNPFVRLAPPPADGADLNPLLQDPGLIIHPPFLYLGYVGFAAAFAFACAALIERRSDRDWATWTRPWALAAWSFMGIGIMLGAWWSFAELGWGGFWAWDPVENASLMPWIAGAALIHSLRAVSVRGAFKSWAFLLAILAFSLSLVGTFLVRSGLLTSVHAFAVDPERGVFILGILGAAVGGALALYALRSPGGPATHFELASRETGVLVNNLLLMVVLGVVFIGTFSPVFNDAVNLFADGDVNGPPIWVGAPYFNLVITPFALLLMFAVAIGQRLPWRHGDFMTAVRPLAPVAGAALVIGVTLYAVHEPRGLLAMATIGLAVWIAGGVLLDLIERLEPLDSGAGEWRDRLARIPFRVWAMNVAHLGVAVVALGVAGTGALRHEQINFMNPGETVTLPGGRVLTFMEMAQQAGPNYAAGHAVFEVRQGRGAPQTLIAERRYYPVRSMETAEAGIASGAAGDVYVTVGLRSEDGRGWAVSASFFPFTVWIWIGGLMVALGGFLGILDHARSTARQRASQAAPASEQGLAVAPAPAE